jgi:beta-lactamase class A
VLFCFVAYVSYTVGYSFSAKHFDKYLKDFKPIRRGGERYKYINPLVGTDSPNAFDVGYYGDLHKNLNEIIKSYQSKGVNQYAIYYRELNSSVWFGINDSEEFFPASLLKLTIALVAYKQDEDRPGFLDSRLVFTQAIKDGSLPRRNEDTSLTVGASYTVRSLIELMIINSDNSARDLIISAVSSQYVDELYQYLNIAQPSADKNFKISIANYALFFRMLYSSTFINEDHSEELLKILIKTNFPFGIVRDIPSDIPVAHKYGVFNLPKDKNGVEMQELHDCGIIYMINNPYLLCIMTEGPDQTVLADFMATISKKIHEFSVER